MQAVSGSSQAALPSSTGGEVSFVQSELWVHLVGTFLALRSSGGRLTPPVRWVTRRPSPPAPDHAAARARPTP